MKYLQELNIKRCFGKRNLQTGECKWNIEVYYGDLEKVKINPDSKPLYVHYSGIDLTGDIVRNVLVKTTQISRIPECIRIAHMIGESFTRTK